MEIQNIGSIIKEETPREDQGYQKNTFLNQDLSQVMKKLHEEKISCEKSKKKLPNVKITLRMDGNDYWYDFHNAMELIKNKKAYYVATARNLWSTTEPVRFAKVILKPQWNGKSIALVGAIKQPTNLGVMQEIKN